MRRYRCRFSAIVTREGRLMRRFDSPEPRSYLVMTPSWLHGNVGFVLDRLQPWQPAYRINRAHGETNESQTAAILTMTPTRWLIFALAFANAGLIEPLARGQFPDRGRRPFGRGSVPEWELPPHFTKDCFTFVRIKYRSSRDRSSYCLVDGLPGCRSKPFLAPSTDDFHEGGSQGQGA